MGFHIDSEERQYDDNGDSDSGIKKDFDIHWVMNKEQKKSCCCICICITIHASSGNDTSRPAVTV